jgi:tetratricopeptide (TPR) repeat protein
MDEPVVTGPKDVDYWEMRKGNCEQVLGAPQAYGHEELVQCMKVWETYRSVHDLSLSVRSMYAVAFSKVWYDTEDLYTKAIADVALGRLCVKRHPLVNGQVKEELPSELACGTTQHITENKDPSVTDTLVAAQESPITSKRGTVPVDKVSDKRAKKAATSNKNGVRSAGKKAYGKAVESYEAALETYPHYVTAKYNLVCVLALMGDTTEAMRHLEELYTWDDSEVEARLIKARTDEDLVLLRDIPEFKQMTGYFRLVLANGAGEIGVEPLTRIKTELEARRFVISDVRNLKQPLLTPTIWYRDGFEDYVSTFKTIIGTQKVKTFKIDWDTLEDVIVAWGQPEAASLAGTGQAAPVVQGTRASGDSGGLDDVTKAIKDTQGSVEGAVDAGGGAVDAVPK